MAGIYFHIPFCKQACHYCDFHFSTSLKKKDELLEAMLQELKMRKEEVTEPVRSIYFGGGTPSLMSIEEIESLVRRVYSNFQVEDQPEITLEANPDDLTENYLKDLSESSVNRLSIGVQSFYKEDLQLMNRAHSMEEAIQSLEWARKYFNNISADLIYGIPGLSDARWESNLRRAFSLEIPHLSCYALTVEPKTALDSFIKKGIISPVDEEQAHRQYELLLDLTAEHGYDNYEFSNFGKPGFRSVNNTAYWEGKPYLGIGPSAHSFDGKVRSWNVANNTKYIKSLAEGVLPVERESLSVVDRYNEYIMTALRTEKGVSLEHVQTEFGERNRDYLLEQAQKPIGEDLLFLDGEVLAVTRKGKFLSDGIASHLFLVNLK